MSLTTWTNGARAGVYWVFVLTALVAARKVAGRQAPPGPRSDGTAPVVTASFRPEMRLAWEWNQQALAAVRADRARPTVQARNLFHVSAAMYDAWAAYSPRARGCFFTEKLHDAAEGDGDQVRARQREALSVAAYEVIRWKYGRSPGSVHTMTALEGAMRSAGFAPHAEGGAPDSPGGVGHRVAERYIAAAKDDGSLELQNYIERPRYTPLNAPLDPLLDATVALKQPDHWQPLVVDGATQRYVTPHWGSVRPFALPTGEERFAGLAIGPPTLAGGTLSALREQLVELIRFNSWCDTAQGVRIEVSPAAIGGNTLGADDGHGYDHNPLTSNPYEASPVNRGDWVRVVADYWADGPGSDTPPGHWNQIARSVSLDPRLGRRFLGKGPVLDELEWDVKLLFTLNAALHDAAIAAWDLKGRFDSVRPVSIIRWMGAQGQCTERSLPSFSEQGLPLVPGLIELISAETTADGARHARLRGHEGKLAVLGWAGPPRPQNQVVGVTWLLAERWMPFQPWDFTTPAFPGYVSGHSTFSRAAAEVLTRVTGSEYFPGGQFEVTVAAEAGLKIESGPSEAVTLRWARYFDTSDQSGLSRRYGGIHIAADDFDGRKLGARIGKAAVEKAASLFSPNR